MLLGILDKLCASIYVLCTHECNFGGKYGTNDRLCGLVVRVLGYRSEGPGSIPGTTRFSEEKKKSSGSGKGSTQPREYN
jgi:hypothetical protein